jgi:demethylmenaquinone methyltransferase/2-methoxy-6-polyprenyl-1,4-benzoquinol methylase
MAIALQRFTGSAKSDSLRNPRKNRDIMKSTQETNEPVASVPHPPLTEYYNSEEERRNWVNTIFNNTAADYDRMETILGLGTGPRYRRQILQQAGLKPGMEMLDVGIGTGLVALQAVAILGDASKITGVDPSVGMMQSARLPPEVKLVEGRAEQIPLPDASYDFLSMGYALRHVSDLSLAFSEYFRVLKPGGRACILEITAPKGPVATVLLKSYFRYVVPNLAKLVAKQKDTPLLWQYYWDTIEACVPPESVLNTLKSVGFTNVRRTVDLGIFTTYLADKPYQAEDSRKT